MLELAERALHDLRHATNMLDVAEDKQTIRVLTVAAVSLNRSIGYALEKDPNKRVRETSRRLYREWKQDENSLFNTFIQPYRNHVIHEVEDELCFDAPLAATDGMGDIIEVFGNDCLYIPVGEIDECDCGDLDIRDLLHDSINWWEDQLETIKETIQAAASKY